MFNVGDVLTCQEISENLEISQRTWEANRKKYLEHLQQFYKIEIIGNGSSRRYKIIEQLQEYEPYMSPRSRKAMEKEYRKAVFKEISKPNMNLQLYTTMTNRVIAQHDEKIEKYQHKKKTTYKYVSDGMKEMFGKNAGEYGTEGKYVKRVWARKIEVIGAPYDFEEMKGEELKVWKEMLKGLSDKKMADAYAQYKTGELEETIAKDIVFESFEIKYLEASAKFEERFGYIPQRVKKYAIGAKEGDFIAHEEED